MSSLLSGGIFRTVVKKVSPVIPQIEKPKKKVTLKNKLIWTGIALLIYFVMG
jgi:preprotein translocase subunit SecY/protein transport protein SEC61 subunit alpha